MMLARVSHSRTVLSSLPEMARGVPSAYHVIKGITHYGVYREGFEEATRI